MAKRIELVEDRLIYRSREGEPQEFELKDADYKDQVLIMGNIAYPLDELDEIVQAWYTLYPNGREASEPIEQEKNSVKPKKRWFF